MPNKKIPQLPETVRVAAAGDKLLMWDDVAKKTTQVDVTNLPFTANPVNVDITLLGSPFPVRNGYASLVYDELTGDSTITDLRLIGKEDYAVSTTQFGGGEFRDDVLVYDSAAGSVKIIGFKLDDGEKIRVYADGVQGPSTAQTYKAINDRLNAIEAMLAPIKPTALGANGAKVLWNKPANEIPAGWREWEDIRGRVPVAYLPGDADFGAMGAPGGSKTKTIKVEQMPEHIHGLGKEFVQGASPAVGGLVGDGWNLGSAGNYAADQGTGPQGNGQPLNVMNPYRVVMWIEYVGLD